ncbi:MAG: alpha/beta hydrolase [Desulfurococcaceae archaeon]
MDHRLLKRRSVKLLIIVATLYLILYIIPIPPVGESVTELAFSESKFIRINGILIHYVEHGRGNTLYILLHGFGASVFTWRELIPSLSNTGRVVAFDRPGFGLTERASPYSNRINPYHVDGAVELTCNFIKSIHNGESNIFLIGHSAGGGLALLVTLRCDVKLTGLVLIAPAWRPYNTSSLEKILYNLPLVDKYGPLITRLFIAQLESALYKAWYNKSMLTSDVVEGYKYPLRARDWDKGLYWLMKYRGFPDIRDDLINMKIPVLIIHGVQDEIVDVNDSIELYEALSNHTITYIVTIDQCGHLPHEEKPELVIDETLKFIYNSVLWKNTR